jgi:ketosteroid isomerase-like protein
VNTRERNVELARAAFDVFDRRDMDGVFAIAANDVEVGAAPELPNSGPYHGHDGIVTWIAQWLEAWGEFRIEVVDVVAIDDEHVLVEVDQHGRGQGSGLEVTQRGLAYVVTARDGLIVRLFLYPDRAAALRAIEVT